MTIEYFLVLTKSYFFPLTGNLLLNYRRGKKNPPHLGLGGLQDEKEGRKEIWVFSVVSPDVPLSDFFPEKVLYAIKRKKLREGNFAPLSPLGIQGGEDYA